MTEDEARAWLDTSFAVPRETLAQIEAYIGLLFAGMADQNLIAQSTRDHVWARHIVDSAQLLPLAASAGEGAWIDLGAGAGLPGIVIGILSSRRVLLIESRRKRVEFLQHVVDTLGLHHIGVVGGRVETAQFPAAAVISARAYAPLPKLLESAFHLADKNTLWLLPKGRNAQIELETVRPTWQGAFHVERSVTDPESAIVVAQSVSRKGRIR